MTGSWAVAVALGAGLQAPPDPAPLIEKHRKGELVVRVEAEGKPVAGARVEIAQTRHAFLFGCNVFGLRPDDAAESQKAYQDRFRGLFNYATLPFYWGSYEKERDRPEAPRLRAMAEWCVRHGIEVKGHPVIWHEVFPKWIRAEEPLEPLLRKRVKETVGAFRGLVDRWDVVNESLVAAEHRNPYGAWVKETGPTPAVETCLRWAAEENPGGTFLVNDFKIHPDYEKQLADLRARKAPFQAAGLQSHMHAGEWTLARVWDVCERYGKIGLPVHFTEVSVLSGIKEAPMTDWQRRRPDWPSTPEQEARQADYVERFYTTLFSHPAVEAVTWWDFADAGAWMGAPAGFLRKDGSPKPAYERLLALIKGAWWTRHAEARSGDDGTARLRGFYGRYAVTVTLPGGSVKTASCELRKGAENVLVVRPD